MKRKHAYAVFVLCAATAIALPAQTFTTLHRFCNQGGQCANGERPWAGLVQATDGNLYGTTLNGGAEACDYGCGTVFKITPSGALTTIYSFCSQGLPCADGEDPSGVLVQASDGDFYGTTQGGGASDACAFGCGTVFKITPGGVLTTLYTFCSLGPPCTDGEGPNAGLVQATNGDFYGTTYGYSYCCGTVFRITPSGTLTTLHTFSGGDDGASPWAGLVQAANGDLYGTTALGGDDGGTIFRITPGGTLTTLYMFDYGGQPYAALVQAANGDLYGTTLYGGAKGGGTVFKISPSGTLTYLYSFCSRSACLDGFEPATGLVQATDGNLYGTTELGGSDNSGTIFRITPGGTLTTLLSFDGRDGQTPLAPLVQATNGNLYGTVQYGGSYAACFYGCGTVFRLSVGLGPFVDPQPASGKVGAVVEILGTDLTGVTSVTFNGTPAVIESSSSSASAITTTVPAGATSGRIQVVTSSGALSSNVPFRVLP